MKLIRTEDAVGHVLCHDITQIIKGVTKDAVFRKGHIVTEEDIPVLLSYYMKVPSPCTPIAGNLSAQSVPAIHTRPVQKICLLPLILP